MSSEDYHLKICLWQTMPSPHMMPIAEALAAREHNVRYIVTDGLSGERAKLGWGEATTSGVEHTVARSRKEIQHIIADSASETVHLMQGLRGSGGVSLAQSIMTQRHVPFWPMIETIDERSHFRHLKRLIYRSILTKRRRAIEGIFSIGSTTSSWLQDRGADGAKIFPFTYFLPNSYRHENIKSTSSTKLHILFVGRLVKLKRLDLLIHSLARLGDNHIHLTVIGEGPEFPYLRQLADKYLPGKVSWLGRASPDLVRAEMYRSDCLVLPSEHDGWGVVISEALSAGLPVVCSSRCGAAGVVARCGLGCVFESGNLRELEAALRFILRSDMLRTDKRVNLARWATCLSATAGAEYLEQVVFSVRHGLPRPKVPWD